MYLFRLVKASCFALVLTAHTACGGGGSGGGDDDVVETQTVVLTVNRDRSARMFSTPPHSLLNVNPTVGVVVGHTPTLEYRGILTWQLPLGVTADQVQSATVRVNQQVASSDLYTALGGMRWETIDVGAVIDQSDFNSAARLRPISRFIEDASLGIKEVGMTGVVQAALNADEREISIRLRFDPPSMPDTLLTQLNLNGTVDYELVLVITP